MEADIGRLLREKYIELFRDSYSKKKAINKIEKMTQMLKELNADSALLEFVSALMQWVEGNIEGAFKNILKSLAEEPQNAYALHTLGIINADLNKHESAIECFEKSLELDESLALSWNDLGLVYKAQKDYIKAVECFKKSLDLDARYANPVNNLGNISRLINNYDDAINYYKKASVLNPSYAAPWNGLGNIARVQKDFDKAIHYYEKATRLRPERPLYWRNMARTFQLMDNYEMVIECYNKLFKLEENADDYRQLGKILLKQNDFVLAQKYFIKALKLYSTDTKKDKNNYWLSVTKSYLEETENAIKTVSLIESKTSEEEDRVIKILLRTREIEEKALENQISFLKFLSQKEDIQEENDFRSEEIEPYSYLEVLRRWNSYTPILADNYHISKGGGYFLKTHNKGIVIDPGFNFIENFKGAKHYFHEIDIICISHAHNDHASDLESILTLLYKYNEAVKGLEDFKSINTVRSDIAKSKNKSIMEVSEAEIEIEFVSSPRKKIIDLYFTASVFKKYSGLFELFLGSNYLIHIIEKTSKATLDTDVELQILDAKHNDIISDCSSVGFLIKFEQLVLIYTGDTGWDKRIEKQYRDILSDFGDRTKLVIAHLGGFKDYEINYINPDHLSGKVFYKHHLGRLGLAKLVETVEPDVCLISEFGEEFKGSRIKISNIFNDIYSETTFFPADIEFTYNIDNAKVKGVSKVDIEMFSMEYSFFDPQQIKVCELRKDYSLHYFDCKGDFSESDLIQVLAEEYEKSLK